MARCLVHIPRPTQRAGACRRTGPLARSEVVEKPVSLDKYPSVVAAAAKGSIGAGRAHVMGGAFALTAR